MSKIEDAIREVWGAISSVMTRDDISVKFFKAGAAWQKEQTIDEVLGYIKDEIEHDKYLQERYEHTEAMVEKAHVYNYCVKSFNSLKHKIKALKQPKRPNTVDETIKEMKEREVNK